MPVNPSNCQLFWLLYGMTFINFVHSLSVAPPSVACEAPPTAPPPSPVAAAVFFFFFLVLGLFPVEAGMSPKMSSVFPKSSSSVLPLVFFLADFFFFGSLSSANRSLSGSSLEAAGGAGGGAWDCGLIR